MTISDIEGKLIVLESSQYEAGLIANSISSVTVTASYNGNDPVAVTASVSSPRTYMVDGIPLSSLTVLNHIYIKNIITSQVFDLLNGDIVLDNVGAGTVVQNQVTAQLAVYGITGVSQSLGLTNGMIHYSLSGLPAHIIMYTAEYTYSTSNQIAYFSLYDDTGLLLGGDSIIITPTFFGLDAFVDGVYNIELVISLVGGVDQTEEGCYFLDISLKCRLILNDDIECGTDKSYLDYLMLHYSLTQASNCNCDCSKMLDIFNFLDRILPLTANTEDCGCN